MQGPAADYVARVGRRIAVQSGLSNSERDFTVTLLDSSVANAFALPGGYVYVTRQLLAQMNDEAELAAVLGHEVGHVAARHSTKRSTTSTIGQILSTGVGVLTGSSAIGQIAGYGAQLYTLRFSRSQEFQADDLGIRYLAGARYDPAAAADMLALIGAESRLAAQVKGKDEAVPTWANTHPNTVDRVQRARSRAGQTGAGGGERNRDAFLTAIDGLVYDDQPAQGIVDGRTFRHPGIGLRFTAPPGFEIENGAESVKISGPDAQAVLRCGRSSRSVEEEVAATFRGIDRNSGIDARMVTARSLNGIPAAQATARAGLSLDLTIASLRPQAGTACSFALLTRAGAGVGAFAPMLDSVARLGPEDEAAVRGRRVTIVTVRPGDTAATLAARMAYPDYRLERFLTLNGLAADRPLAPGDKVKLIVRQ